MDSISIIADFGAAITSLLAAWVVWLGHRLTSRQRADAWLDNLNKLHLLFWEDADFIEVREYIALDSQYEALCSSIEIRFLHPKQLTREDYHKMELLDKFFNFLIRVRLVDSQLDAKRDLWEELIFEYWLDSITDRQRWHLFMYFESFFGNTSIGNLLKSPEDPKSLKELNELRVRLC